MRYPRVLGIVALGLVLSAPAAVSASAAPTSLSGVFDLGTGTGTFTVDSGPLGDLCSSGATADQLLLAVGAPQSGRQELLVRKEFTCIEGPTFTMLLTVRIDFAPEFAVSFTWTVVDATGDLAGMHGAGTGTGVSGGSVVFDAYSGTVVLE
jgi:hypothetical protein